MKPTGRRWKRSDVTTGMLLDAIDRFGVNALDRLAQDRRIPAKVLVAAVLRDAKTGYLTYGVSVWRPLLDWRGLQVMVKSKEVLRADGEGDCGHRLGGDRGDRGQREGAVRASAGNVEQSTPDREGRQRGTGCRGGGVLVTVPVDTVVHRSLHGAGYVSHGPDSRRSQCEGVRAVVDTGRTNPLGEWRVVASHNNPATGAAETQEVRGTSAVVAAWLRAVADQLDPPRRPMRGGGAAGLDPAEGPRLLPRPLP